MEIILFWEDKNWKERGYANNVWLYIYPDDGEYQKVISFGCDITRKNVIEVTRKTDIENMIRYLTETCNYEERK